MNQAKMQSKINLDLVEDLNFSNKKSSQITKNNNLNSERVFTKKNST